MAITNTRQNWTTGQTVKVGFLSLMVVQCIPTPGDYAPDAYILVNRAQTQLYKFVPHNGLQRLALDEAEDLVAGAVRLSQQQAQRAIRTARAMPIQF